MSGDLVNVVSYFRLVERGLLTLFVLVACIWLLRKYSHEVTNINLATEKLALSSLSVAIGTPLLIVLLFVGYTYVDLSNPIEVQAAAATNLQGRGPETRSFRGLNEPGEASGPNGPPATAPSDAAAREAFTLWTEQESRRVFVSIANTAKPLTPQAASRALTLTFAVGCLRTEADRPARSIDAFVAGKDLDRLDVEIAAALTLPGTEFVNGFCRALQHEMEKAP